MHLRRVWKQGKSLCVTIPKPLARMMGLRIGDYLQFTVEKDKRVKVVKSEPTK